MKAGKLNVPSSWDHMTRHNRAYYLMNSYQAKTWQEAIALAVHKRKKKAKIPEQLLLTTV